MTNTDSFSRSEGFKNDKERRKRLGQYPTGTGLGRVIAALAKAHKSKSIIDPMGGTGDLLLACKEVGARAETLCSVEIDPIAHAQCESNLPDAVSILGNIFSLSTLNKLPCSSWDLVISNPPYIRYQSLKQSAGEDFQLPNSTEIRNELFKCIEHLPSLDEEDKIIFRHLISSYSGLSDVAVPSWILCAGLVKPGGRLALVVPDSWLNRNYASVVQYILLRWFSIEHIVEDSHAVWFDDAQIKTNLVVAKRTYRKESVFKSHDQSTYLQTSIRGSAATSTSPIGNVSPSIDNLERTFADKLISTLKHGSNTSSTHSTSSVVPVSGVVSNFRSIAAGMKWLSSIEDAVGNESEQVAFHPSCKTWLNAGDNLALTSLSSLGVTVGQGLRTGANGFFYCHVIEKGREKCLIRPAGYPEFKEVEVPFNLLQPVVRNQSDIGESLVVNPGNLNTFLLYLRSVALPEDIESNMDRVFDAYKPMGPAVAEFVRCASRSLYGKDGNKKPIYELSAVSPNIRKGNPLKNIAPSFWYQLPKLAPRHQPDLFVPRINYESPQFFLSGDSHLVVDANFSTLCINKNSSLDKYSLLALLNSSWCRANLEYIATVMGGGALKLEAAHLKRLALPVLEKDQINKLSELGSSYLAKSISHEELDHSVLSIIVEEPVTRKTVHEISSVVESAILRRKNHSKKEIA